MKGGQKLLHYGVKISLIVLTNLKQDKLDRDGGHVDYLKQKKIFGQTGKGERVFVTDRKHEFSILQMDSRCVWYAGIQNANTDS